MAFNGQHTQKKFKIKTVSTSVRWYVTGHATGCGSKCTLSSSWQTDCPSQPTLTLRTEVQGVEHEVHRPQAVLQTLPTPLPPPLPRLPFGVTCQGQQAANRVSGAASSPLPTHRTFTTLSYLQSRNKLMGEGIWPSSWEATSHMGISGFESWLPIPASCCCSTETPHGGPGCCELWLCPGPAQLLWAMGYRTSGWDRSVSL